jgi:hypothetical protein
MNHSVVVIVDRTMILKWGFVKGTPPDNPIRGRGGKKSKDFFSDHLDHVARAAFRQNDGPCGDALRYCQWRVSGYAWGSLDHRSLPWFGVRTVEAVAWLGRPLYLIRLLFSTTAQSTQAADIRAASICCCLAQAATGTEPQFSFCSLLPTPPPKVCDRRMGITLSQK